MGHIVQLFKIVDVVRERDNASRSDDLANSLL